MWTRADALDIGHMWPLSAVWTRAGPRAGVSASADALHYVLSSRGGTLTHDENFNAATCCLTNSLNNEERIDAAQISNSKIK